MRLMLWRKLPAFLVPLIGFLVCGFVSTWPQSVHAQSDVHDVVDAPARDIPYLRLSLDLSATSRTFTARSERGDTDFDAPLKPGLNLRLHAYPLMALLQTRSLADGIGFYLDNSRLKLNTQVAWEDDEADQSFLVDVPTRMSMLRIGTRFDLPVHDQVRLHASVGYSALSYALAYNRILASNFYRGVELGLGATVSTTTGIDAGLEGRWMPSVTMGDSASNWGDLQNASALGAEGLLRWRFYGGFFTEARAEFRMVQAEFSFAPTEAESVALDLSDQYLTFALAFGYAFGRPSTVR